jgi:cobalt-zinc-cadmium efflux system outer membrane protein
MKNTSLSVALAGSLASLLVGCAAPERGPQGPPVAGVVQPAVVPGDADVFQEREVSRDVVEDVELAEFDEPAAMPNGTPETAVVTAIEPIELERQTAFSLDALEQLAVANNPALAQARFSESIAGGLRHQVGLAPNPTFSYFGQQLANENTDQQGVMVEQEIVRGDKLGLNRAVLGHTVNAQRWESWTQRQRVLTDVRLRFYEALAGQLQIDATQDFLQVAAKGVQVASQRVEAGEGTRIDLLQSQTLLSETELAIEQRQAVVNGTLRDLAALVGMPELDVRRLEGELIESPADKPAISYEQIVARSPELAAAKALVCEKQALLERQQAQPIPNLLTQLGGAYDNATESGMINVQVGAPIPVWNQNEGNVTAALNAYRRAVQDVERIEADILSRYAVAVREYESAVAAVKRYRNEILPQTEESLRLSEESYLAGELDFLQVLVVRQDFYQARIQEIDASGRVSRAIAVLEGLLLTGGLEAPADYTAGDGIRGSSFGGQ